MENGNVVILCPMDCECEFLVSQISQKEEKRIGGYIFYEGKIGKTPVVAVRCLIGMVNAAVCTTLAIERYNPEYVIIQGTSGAHIPELNKNDIVIADRVVSITNTVSLKRKSGEGSNPLEWDEFGVQAYSKKNDVIDFANVFFCDKKLVELAKTVTYKSGKVLVGAVGCGDVWNREADLIAYFHSKKGTLCEAMEGVSVAQVCEVFGVPMLEIRVISNNELHEDEHFTTDTALNSQQFVIGLLEAVNKSNLQT